MEFKIFDMLRKLQLAYIPVYTVTILKKILLMMSLKSNISQELHSLFQQKGIQQRNELILMFNYCLLLLQLNFLKFISNTKKNYTI